MLAVGLVEDRQVVDRGNLRVRFLKYKINASQAKLCAGPALRAAGTSLFS